MTCGTTGQVTQDLISITTPGRPVLTGVETMPVRSIKWSNLRLPLLLLLLLLSLLLVPLPLVPSLLLLELDELDDGAAKGLLPVAMLPK